MEIPIMGMVTGMVINLIFWGAVAFSGYYIIKNRNRERMAKIEKGVDISQLYDKKERANLAMKWGMFFVGISFGVLVGYLLTTQLGLNGVVSFTSMILLFAGASLILFHRYNSKQVTE
jgi:D-alanyl-lipoteichoic acid acyltransferase DltB (MBOAT superfamily)